MSESDRHARWLLVSSLGGLGLLGAVGAGLPSAVEWLMLGSLTGYAVLLYHRGDPSRAADRVSASRAALATAALACGHIGAYVDVQLALFLLALLTDLLDGWLARRDGVTESGAVLDMEADQLLVLSMAVAAIPGTPFGAAVLLLPAFKYCFVLLNRMQQLPGGDPKPVNGCNRRAKLIYLLVLAALFSALPALDVPSLSTVLLALALPALGASFAADFRYQRAHRRSPAL